MSRYSNTGLQSNALSNTTVAQLQNISNAIKVSSNTINLNRNVILNEGVRLNLTNSIINAASSRIRSNTLETKTLLTNRLRTLDGEDITINTGCVFLSDVTLGTLKSKIADTGINIDNVNIKNNTIRGDVCNFNNLQTTNATINTLNSGDIQTSNIGIDNNITNVNGLALKTDTIQCKTINPFDDTLLSVNIPTLTTGKITGDILEFNDVSNINGTTFTPNKISSDSADHINCLINNLTVSNISSTTSQINVNSDLDLLGHDINNVRTTDTNNIAFTNLQPKTDTVQINNIIMRNNSIYSTDPTQKINIGTLETSLIQPGFNNTTNIQFIDSVKLNYGTASKNTNTIEDNPEIQFINNRIAMNQNGILLKNIDNGVTNFIELSVTEQNRLSVRSVDFNMVFPDIKDIVFDVLTTDNQGIIINNDTSRCSFREIEGVVTTTFELNISLTTDTNTLNFTLPENFKPTYKDVYGGVYIVEVTTDTNGLIIEYGNTIKGYTKVSPQSDFSIFTYDVLFENSKHYFISGTAIYNKLPQLNKQPYIYKNLNFIDNYNIINSNNSRYLNIDTLIVFDLNMVIDFSQGFKTLTLYKFKPVQTIINPIYIYNIGTNNDDTSDDTSDDTNNGDTNPVKLVYMKIDSSGIIEFMKSDNTDIINGVYNISASVTYETSRDSTTTANSFFFSQIL